MALKSNPPAAKPADAIAAFLKALGQNEHPETGKTPERVEELWTQNLLSGEGVNAEEVLSKRIVDTAGVTVLLQNIPFHGVCPHHLVPYFGHVDLAYDPNGFIVGLGALEELVATLSRRLILQEELTGLLITTLEKALHAKGVACRVEAQHLCLMLRGREPRATRLVTHRATGTLDGRWDLFTRVPPTTGIEKKGHHD